MENSEDRKEEATNKINLKVDPVTVKPEDRNQDVTDKTDQEAIKQNFHDISSNKSENPVLVFCHLCGVEFKNNRSDISDEEKLRIHMRNFHHIFSDKSEIPTIVKIEDDTTNDITEKDEEILVGKKFSGKVNETSIIEPITINNISEEDEETLVRGHNH